VNDTERRVVRVFHDALGVDVPSPTLDVIEEGMLDSLGLVTLLVELEREFTVVIPLELDIDSLRTVERLAAFVEQVSAEGGSTA
jgi:D-alanine--poly(phosphoribitol) ligase subunit 2